MTPQLVDFNGDGFQDMVMATFEGTAFLVEGSEDGWKEPVHIVDENDTNVRISFFYDNEKGDYASIDRSTDDYESNENDHMTAVSVVDWDSDGDQDLILAAHEGGLYRCMNIGSMTEPKFAATNEQIMFDGKPMRLNSLTTPRIADWNGDGLWDLIVGTVEGEVFLYQNDGEAGKPKFSKRSLLLKTGATLEKQLKLADASVTAIGNNPYMEAVDYDNDGDLDLIVGTHTVGKNSAKPLTKEEEKKCAELEAQMKEIQEKLGVAFKDCKSNDDFEKLVEENEDIQKLMEKSEKVYDELDSLKPYFESPHLVWLFRNKSIDHRANGRTEESKAGVGKIEVPTDFDSSKFEIRASIVDKKADGNVTLVVHVNVPQGYHIYGAKNQMIPTKLSIDEADDVSVLGDAVVPEGKVKLSSGKRSYWLEKVVTITQKLNIDSDAQAVSGHVAYMMCDENTCRPPAKEKFTVDLK